MTPAIDVSYVISSHNGRTLLEHCLESVRRDLAVGGLTAETIVVDDGSTDGSAAMVAARFPEVRVIESPANVGYARANNLGIRAARGRAVFLLNADTTILPGATRSMYDALMARSDLATVGPRLLNRDGTIQRSCWKFPLESLIANTLLLPRLGVWDDYRTWDHHADREIAWICSAALMVRKEAFEAVGLFDEQFWVYGVDVDWALRARRKGYRHLSLASAAVVHYGKSSWLIVPGAMAWDHIGWHYVFFQKHYGLAGAILYRMLVMCNSLVRLLVWGSWYLLGHRQFGPKVAHFSRQFLWALRSHNPNAGSAGPDLRPQVP